MRFTLVADGSSDQALIPILYWCLREAGVVVDLGVWADFRNLRHPPMGLSNRIRTALILFPCDLLFVHRDAEASGWARRNEEIHQAIKILRESGMTVPHVCVIPVRMLEAWLLFNERAIRTAVNNPNGNVGLDLPRLEDVENLSDPKQTLVNLLRLASELPPHRLQKMRAAQARLRITELIDNFAPLRALPAFQELETQLAEVVRDSQWT